MGLGDEIMITALANKNRREGWLTIVTGKDGNLRWHPVWDSNPNMYRNSDINIVATLGIKTEKNHSGRRHYIDWTQSTSDRWVFQPWDIEPGEIFFSREENFFHNAARLDNADILIDPGIKDGRDNKQWGSGKWLTLCNMLEAAGLPYNVNDPAKSPDLRVWLGNLKRYKLIICHEGGLHHAAAALGIPCITIFGGFISPEITGYILPNHRNLTHAKEFCGMILPCQHCQEEMNAIHPKEVMEHVKDLLYVNI